MKRANFYLDESEIAILKAAAKKFNLSQAALIRLMIRKYLSAAVTTPQSDKNAA